LKRQNNFSYVLLFLMIAIPLRSIAVEYNSQLPTAVLSVNNSVTNDSVTLPHNISPLRSFGPSCEIS